MKFVPAVYSGTCMIPVNFCDYRASDYDPDLDLIDFFNTMLQIIKFVPAVYIGTWMIPVNLGYDGNKDCDLDPDSGSL